MWNWFTPEPKTRQKKSWRNPFKKKKKKSFKDVSVLHGDSVPASWQRWRAEVTSAGLLRCGLRSPLDVGDLQDGHQQLESILDVRCTVGCLWGRRIYHMSAWGTQYFNLWNDCIYASEVTPCAHTSTTFLKIFLKCWSTPLLTLIMYSKN